MSDFEIFVDNHRILNILRNLSTWIGVLGCWLSLSPWIIWSAPNINILIMTFFILLRLPFINTKIDYSSIISISAVILFAFIYCQFFINNLIVSIYTLLSTIFPIIVFIMFNSDEKDLLVQRLIKFFSLILIFSVVYYILSLFVDLPHFRLQHYNPAYPYYDNYIFFVSSSTIESAIMGFARFRSIYTEPGHLAMICAIFLYINEYTWKKWQNVVLTVSLFLSLSLAGFLLYFIGLILYLITKSNNLSLTLFKILSMSLLITVGTLSFYSPTNDDIISTMILSRLEYDESNGVSGNNRNSEVFDYYYDIFLSSDQRFLGIGGKEMERKFSGTGNSSYKNYILERGFVGFFALLFLMITLLYCYPSRKGFGLMLLLIASFIQRPYFMWAIECIPYIGALSYFYNENSRKKQRHYSIIKNKPKVISCKNLY